MHGGPSAEALGSKQRLNCALSTDDADRQQLRQRNQERPSTATLQQSTDAVRLDDLDIYIVS